MAIWILTGINSRLNAITQIAAVLTMNLLEFILVPELLLWGRLNLLFAVLFVLLVYYNQFLKILVASIAETFMTYFIQQKFSEISRPDQRQY